MPNRRAATEAIAAGGGTDRRSAGGPKACRIGMVTSMNNTHLEHLTARKHPAQRPAFEARIGIILNSSKSLYNTGHARFPGPAGSAAMRKMKQGLSNFRLGMRAQHRTSSNG